MDVWQTTITLPPVVLVLFQALTPLLGAVVTGAERSDRSANRRRNTTAIFASVALLAIRLLTDDIPDSAETFVSQIIAAVATPTAAYLTVWKHFNINETVLPHWHVDAAGFTRNAEQRTP